MKIFLLHVYVKIRHCNWHCYLANHKKNELQKTKKMLFICNNNSAPHLSELSRFYGENIVSRLG